MARNVSIQVQLTPEIKSKFQEVAASYGMTMSALGSFVIGQFVNQQVNIIQPLQAQLTEAATAMIQKQVDEMVTKK